MTNNSISLYFHIPFCLKKCDYCAFFSIPNANESQKAAYFEALCRQVSFLPTDREIATIYFGGGTPPLLTVPRLIDLLDRVRKRAPLARDCEITIEINPKTIDFAGLSALKEAGFNRLSIGIQSTDNKVLSALGRVHTFAEAEKCVHDARLAGFTNVSVDFIFALPYRENGIYSELLRIIALNPDHISAYSLQLEEGTPLFERAATLTLPDEDEEEQEYATLCSLLAQHGYEHYEISSFARGGKYSRHNMRYWTLGEYLGLGAGAHSFYQNRRFSAPCEIGAYIEKSALSLLAPTDYHLCPVISPDELAEEAIMLGLRTSNGAIIPEAKAELALKLSSLGLGTYDPLTRRLTLNSRGFRVSNTVIADILC